MSTFNRNLDARSVASDEDDAPGFGGCRGANRRQGVRETLPAASPVSYGNEPGRNPEYGSRGNGEPVTSTTK